MQYYVRKDLRGMRERMHSIRLLFLFANHASPSSISDSLFSFTSMSSRRRAL